MATPGDDQSSPDVAELARINLEMADHERSGAAGAAYFDDLLDANLCFRRGDGSITDKAGFLAGLADPGNTSETLTADTWRLLVSDDQAFAEVHVRLVGQRGGKPIDGTFRNLRLFERQGDTWRCVMWFNKRIADAD